MTLKNDFTDADPMAVVHAGHHNDLATAINAGPTLDSDLVTIAGLSPTDNDILQRKSGAWVGSTPATVKTDLALTKGDVGLGSVDNTSDTGKPISTATQTALDGKQPLDTDLTTIAALAPADNTVMQRKAGAWVGSTPATVKTDLALTKTDVGLSLVENVSITAAVNDAVILSIMGVY